ncbi:MAG: hypothetical protein ACRBB0_23265 [Pelagimonas sp.]|uniref:hypothetical protein n=1 Tax=Pelagimonas sp. TaxID=2073170 RepID=UPI003D6AF48E
MPPVSANYANTLCQVVDISVLRDESRILALKINALPLRLCAIISTLLAPIIPLNSITRRLVMRVIAPESSPKTGKTRDHLEDPS